jgi:hypothetical protein
MQRLPETTHSYELFTRCVNEAISNKGTFAECQTRLNELICMWVCDCKQEGVPLDKLMSVLGTSPAQDDASRAALRASFEPFLKIAEDTLYT